MPSLERPDGATIHWESRGDGPLVVLAMQFFGVPTVFQTLIDDLVGDHRVASYDIRGGGQSSREGPFDPETDADDLLAFLEALGGPAVVLSVADGLNRAIRVSVARPDLVHAVVSPAGSPVGRAAVQGTDGLAASDSVVEALMNMAETDYRGALRAMLSVGSQNLTEDQLRDRIQLTVDYMPHSIAIERMKFWLSDDVTDLSRAIGDKLWILESGTNPWFPIDVVEPTRELLPDAQIEIVEDGAVSRPDITAAYIRRLTSQVA